MLGYGDGTFTRESQFGMAPGGNYGMDDVKCSGSESDIRDCRHTLLVIWLMKVYYKCD